MWGGLCRRSAYMQSAERTPRGDTASPWLRPPGPLERLGVCQSVWLGGERAVFGWPRLRAGWLSSALPQHAQKPPVNTLRANAGPYHSGTTPEADNGSWYPQGARCPTGAQVQGVRLNHTIFAWEEGP